ncbi:MAG: adenylyltransferase/cytidyltransferase family protein [archaeon]|jgi:cytidyltransferase-like protein
MVIIKSKSKLKKIIDIAKIDGKSVLIKKGVFDIIHPGHIYALDIFSKKADIVVILIQSDKFTKKKKGKLRPINPQMQRAQVVDGIKGVDYVYLDKSNSLEDYIKILEYFKPTIVTVISTTIQKQKKNEFLRPYWELIVYPDKKDFNVSTTTIIDNIFKKRKILRMSD